MRPATTLFAAMAAAVLIWVTIVGQGGGKPARADDFFTSSPGPLASSHASLDDADHCNDCHTGGRELSNEKCLGCHDHSDLAARINAGKGFHASSTVKGKKCESCHLDHKGRGYDLMGWRAITGGQDGFDHKLTGWTLEGKHAAIDCSDCHKNKNGQGLRTFIGEDRLCGSCHKKDQPHGFDRREMMACERCHGQSVWKPQKSTLEFDHDSSKDAEMPLEGSHADVSCGKCHPKALFNLKNKDPDFCGNCHKNVHTGHLFGKTDCQQCHSPSYRSLDKFKFDHDNRTKFDLGGAHAKIDCYDCHSNKLGEKKPDKACAPCHAADNKHKDRFDAFGDPPKCETCHPSTSWKPTTFNHSKRTNFDLTGKHAEAECRACHRGRNPADFERFDAKTIGCMGCHQHKNVHDREFEDKQCLKCHKGAGKVDLTPKSVELYHGPDSRFPLVKAHAKVKCVQCHINDTYKDTPMNCGTRCHEDSLHKGELGDECGKCHSGGTWVATEFDHTDHTTWPLVGLHQTVPECKDCHPKRDYDGTPTKCGDEACHADDDAHKGRLGSGCEKCHKETGDNVFSHNTMSRFALDGQHLTTRCADCHPSVTFKPRPTNCFGCHPEPAVHDGQYGTVCEQCHSTESFEDIRPLHDVGDFSLTGAHDNQPCQKCHRDNRPLAGSGNLCLNCHRQDDVHSNSLSPRCGDCHTQWSFAPARFDHATVGCNLTGVHRVMPCYDCHKTGSFGGLQPTCYGCHRDEAARKDAAHQGYTACSTCHSPNAWGAGTSGSGRESICR